MTLDSGALSVSIIIPIYNVDHYLPECLDSILAQDMDKLQVLLIDNASTDQSAAIAKEYAIKWPQIFNFYQQPTKGVSAARNLGIEKATGDYLAFLDADDCFEEASLKPLLDTARKEDADILIANYSDLLSDGTKSKNKPYNIQDTVIAGRVWLEQILKKRKFLPAVWNKLYRRSFMIENNLFFEPNIISAEDLLFTVRTLLLAKTVKSVTNSFYLYRNRESSVSNRTDLTTAIERLNSHIKVTEQLFRITDSCSKQLRKLILERTIKLNLVALQAYYKAAENGDASMAQYFSQLNELNLYRYVRFSRFSHYIDWLTLRLGYEQYFNWRLRKW
ncbi:MAG: glycosyltransferase [Gammaproteobacteria bacterium]|nr:glycosyltransferase [Gammaproteobacteria bacterium]MCP4088549.1 glycosyltransferase [Gammaproteobacteria bacterium]MCP4276711.1 glycosyltransferase [Gammaproteobacteria bacterium]MCP4832420.1 glycosyltransferase [Gammaproteobacteria bacterium]MCP4929861.1 glycosyltransferase [Gammaproteobacteria bacterium]